jgi:thiol-disulfide isomerase/thioredoxin
MGAGVEKATVKLTLGAGGEVIGETETNAYGDFSIRGRPRKGAAVVTITKENLKDAVVEVELGSPEGPPFMAVAIAGAIDIAGTVTDVRTKNPIAGAHIRAESGYKDWNATTAEDGTFKVEGLSPGGVTLTISANGYARQKRGIKHAESAGTLAISLSPERIVRLLIENEAGEAVGGVNIGCVDPDVNDFRQLLSDKEGQATIRELRFEATRLLLRLIHEEYVSSPDFDRVVELPPDQAESTHTLVLHRAGAIVGQVVSAETGTPLIGARVTVGDMPSDYSPRAWSEQDGTYRIIGVAPGEAVVTVHLGGYSPSLAVVAVEAGKDAKADFEMVPPRTVTGTVTAADEKPIGGVYIMTTRWREHASLGLRAMTDEQGRFQIFDAPRDAFDITLYAGGHQPLKNQTVSADKSEYAFTLEAGAAAGKGAAEAAGPRLAVGDAAPALALKLIDGSSVDSSQLKGKVVLLDFWATWCGPCLAEIPNLVEVRKKYGARTDFVMISVSLDDDSELLKKFVEAQKMDWLHACVVDRNAGESADAYHVSYIPNMFVIDREGKIAAVDLHGDGIDEAVARVLGPK